MQKVMAHWYRDRHGNLSPSSDEMLANQEEWQKRYWEAFRLGAITKTSEWGHEREHRLVLHSLLDSFDEKSTRKLKYRFSDLTGIAFGMKTSMADKLRIMKAVEEKCLAEGRTDFEFCQARYSRRDRKMELALLRLLKISLGPESDTQFK
jgi:hypothetical protein